MICKKGFGETFDHLKTLCNGLKIFILCFGTLLLSACSPLSPVSQSPSTTYTLQDPTPENKALVTQSKRTLLVSNVSAVSWLNTPRMAYQMKKQINYFSKNQWISPPNELLQPIIVHALQHAKPSIAVIAAPYIGNYDQRLEIQLINFQQNFSYKPSIFQMTVQARLISYQTQRLIREKRFDITMTAPSDDPAGGVSAANRAVQTWLRQLAIFVR